MNDPETTIRLEDGQFHPDNPVFANPKPKCCECGGDHEPGGARSDCIAYWKRCAQVNYDMIGWARTLLCSATPNAKLLDETHVIQWAKGFGKWFAESHSCRVRIREYGCAVQIWEWLIGGKYRTVIHRHTGTFRALDESEQRFIEADTLPLLCDALLDWKANAQPLTK